jgi:hypothetical protein
MTIQETAQFKNEGEPAFNNDPENDNSASPPEGKETEEDNAVATDGEKNKQPEEKDIPFHQHPRWKEREEAWDKRFNDQELRHQEDLKKIREEFGADRKKNAEQTDIPSWFGGDQDQWNDYRKDRDAEIKAAEERAIQRITDEKGKQDKSVQEATEYMQSELMDIESDKNLNPSGEKIDPNKLLKIVMDNDLVDSKGRWNYRVGVRLMNFGANIPKPGDRKKIAGATLAGNEPEEKPVAYKTSKDFKGANRPW